MGPPTAPQACSAACRPKLQKQEREQHAHITIFHYHCDHLDIPIALTDQTGQVAWAAKLVPSGNVLQEYNPQGIHQAIQLPGSTMTGKWGCITTVIGITIRWWGVISIRIRLG
jgi:L-ascorbate metabolism protein UlaG (beta-lactamase superfamily)